MRSKTQSLGNFSKLLLASSIVGLTFGMTACDGDSRSTTNPVNSYDVQVQNLKGNIQGVLRDAVTNEPIVGAIVDLGYATATTTDRGQYLLKDVPITGADSADATSLGHAETYKVTIDMRAVNAARAKAGKEYMYPDFAYTEWDVNFSSYTPEEANELMDGGTNLSAGTYHTLLTGLVSAFDEEIGKLSTSIKGIVYMDADEYGQVAHLPAANATVLLYSDMDTKNSGTGNTGRLLDTTTTDADGKYSFSSIEAGADIRLVASSENGDYLGESSYTALSGDGDTLNLERIDNAAPNGDDALVLNRAEDQDPVLISVSPENHVDIDPATVSASAPLEVRFTFNRAIVQNAYATAMDASSSAVEGLYKDVAVNFTGAKAGNIAHSLAWSADHKTLIVRIPNLGASSKYEVDISGADLMDSYGRNVDFAANTVNADGVLEFTTRGGLVAGKPVVSVTNAATIDSDSAIVLNWAPVPGAKKYNIYREKVQLWNEGADTNSHGYVKINVVDVFASSYADNPPTNFHFVENDQIQLSYNYYVRAVNSDGLEGEPSDSVNVIDVVAPELTSPGNINSIAMDEFDLVFSEPVRQADAENIANYTFSNVSDLSDPLNPVAPVLEKAEYDVANQTVTLTFDTALIPDLTTVDAVPATIRTGWNGTLTTNVPAMGYAGTEERFSIAGAGFAELPIDSTGWCVYSDTNGQFFSTNSNNYAGNGYNVYSPAINLADEQVVTADGRTVIFTGADGVCDTLNDWATDLNATILTVDWPVVDDAKVNTTWNNARTAITSALVTGASMNSNVNYRLASQVEALNQAALAGLTENGYTFTDTAANPVTAGLVSEWTLAAASRTLAAEHQYFYTGTRGADTIGIVLPGTATHNPTIANWRLRPSLSTNATAYTISSAFETDLTNEAVFLADSDTWTAQVLGAEFLRNYITASGIRDVKGNLIESGAGSNLSGELQDGVIANGTEDLVSH